MRVKVALPIGKPLRRGSFIARSDGVRTWVSFKYERLPLFCHYCGMLGHDVKHCASHFAITQNGGEIEYQYGDSLRARGGRPRSFSPRNTDTSTGAAREQGFEESTSNGPREMASPAADLETTNPSRSVEMDSIILGVVSLFQDVNDVDKESFAYMQHENCSGQIPDSVLKDNAVEQPASLELIDVATGELVTEVNGLDCHGVNNKKNQVVASVLKPKSTWIRINRMDFGLGGLSRALMLPTCGKRSTKSELEEGQREVLGGRETKCVRVRSKDVSYNIISAGVASHPCREQGGS